MAKGWCGACDTLQQITPSDIALEYKTDIDFGRIPVGSARYWFVCMHPDKRKEPDADGRYPLCEGGGRSV